MPQKTFAAIVCDGTQGGSSLTNPYCGTGSANAESWVRCPNGAFLKSVGLEDCNHDACKIAAVCVDPLSGAPTSLSSTCKGSVCTETLSQMETSTYCPSGWILNGVGFSGGYDNSFISSASARCMSFSTSAISTSNATCTFDPSNPVGTSACNVSQSSIDRIGYCSGPREALRAIGFSVGNFTVDRVRRVYGECATLPAPPIIDMCPNIPDAQPTVPAGYIIDASGNCVLPATNSSIQGITLNKANNLGVSTQVTRGFTNTTFAPNYDYYFQGLLAGSYTVTAKIPPGFNAAEYSVCTNAVGTCHTPTSWMPGTSVSVNVPPSNGYVDLWWRFTPIVVPPGVEICTDGIDNDGDGLIDSSDPDCPPPVDVCPNISGIQTTIPPGKMIDTGGNCVPIPPPPVVNIVSPKNDAVVSGSIVEGLMEVNLDWSFSDPVGGTQEKYRIELSDTTDGICASSYSNACLNKVNDFKKTGGSDPHNDDVISLAEGGEATSRIVHLAPGRSYRWRVQGYSTVRNPDGSLRSRHSSSEIFRTAAPPAVPIPTADIKANGSDAPPPIPFNTAATLSWTSTDATSCTASGSWSGSKTPSGSQSTGPLTSSQTYTITCTGPGGISPPDSVVVNVTGAANQPPVAGAQISKDNVAWGGLITVTKDLDTTVYLSARTSSDPDGWTSANGVSSGGKCEWNRDLNQGAPTYEQTISSPTSNLGCETTVTPFPTRFDDPPGTYTYTVLRLTDNGGLQSTATVQVSVVAVPIPTPTVDIKANGSDAPPPIPFNTAATLSWTSTDATSCTASGSWSGSKTPSGSQSTGPLTSSQTYTITCTGPGGISPPDSVVVNVAAPPSCTLASFVGGDVNPLSVAPGGSYTIDCDYGTFTNAIDVIPGSGSCTFDSANSFQSDTVARFNCIAGSTPGGPFPNSCTLGGKPTPPFDNYCARQDRISGRDITVNTPPAVGLFTITHSPLPEGDPATGDTTNCHDIAGNPPCPSPHFARDMRHNGSGAFSTIDVFTIHPQGTFTKDVKISVTAVKRDDFPILEPFDADGDGDLDPNFGDTRGDSAPLENGAMFFLFDGHRMRSKILRYPKRTIEFQTSYPNPLDFPREGRYIIYLDAQALCALDVPCGPIVKNEVLLVVGQTIPGWRER